MIVMLLGALVAMYGAFHVSDIEEKPRDTVYFYQAGNKYEHSHLEQVSVTPLSANKYKNVVRQAYDYSCGSAALTTLLDYYLGRNFQERHVMEGLLEFGETEKIVQRRGFSLLDMKRLVTALGHPAGGFKASMKDLIELEHPGIVPIEYAGFKHFVVLKDVVDGRVFVADPALGNLSFTVARFEEIWDRNVIFVVFPGDRKPIDGLAIKDEDLRYVNEATLTNTATAYLNTYPLTQQKRLDNALGAVQPIQQIILSIDSDGNETEILNQVITDRNPEGEHRLNFKRQ
jgi:predicted double-glycine peptidase